MNKIANTLIEWYYRNKRSLPWREEKNPYKVWISEIILQQTRIASGTAYFHRFVERFPNVESLASAHEDEVLRLWQGLGYYSRARNLHTAAKTIIRDFNGIFPDNHSDILSLRGIGDYTSAAISSIAFDIPVAAVDGNVYRVLSRLFNIQTEINTGKGKREFTELAQELLDFNRPGDFNQAIMEFGALHCTPKNPSCSSCPFLDSCLAYRDGLVPELPKKKRAKAVVDRFFYFFILRKGDSFLIEKRGSKDIWQSLYQLPLLEKNESVNVHTFLESTEFRKFINEMDVQFVSETKQKAHLLSHQRLHIEFVELEILGEIKLSDTYLSVDIDRLDDYAFPKPIVNYFLERDFL